MDFKEAVSIPCFGHEYHIIQDPSTQSFPLPLDKTTTASSWSILQKSCIINDSSNYRHSFSKIRSKGGYDVTKLYLYNARAYEK